MQKKGGELARDTAFFDARYAEIKACGDDRRKDVPDWIIERSSDAYI